MTGGIRIVIDVPGVTRADLATTFAAYGYRKGVEVGTERGEYAEILCKANPQLHLTCVDAWQAYKGYREHVSQEKLDGFYEFTKERLRPYAVQLIRGFSQVTSHAFRDGELDFVYLDANHAYEHIHADLLAWARKVRKGGMVAGHDFCRRSHVNYGVIEAVTDYIDDRHIDTWWVLRGDKSPTWCWVV